MNDSHKEILEGVKLIEELIISHQFEHYHKLYQLLRNGAPIGDMIDIVVKRYEHKLSKRSVYILLTNGRYYELPEDTSKRFYDVSPIDIQEYIKEKLLEIKAKE